MNKVATCILIVGALTLSFGVSAVNASEITGTISTDGGNGTTSGTPNPTPTPTPTPNPSYDTGHISEVGGTLALGGTVEGGGTSAPAVVAAESRGTANVSSWTPADYCYAQDRETLPIDLTWNCPFRTASTTTSSSGASSGISDEEMARLALVNFGARYGVPGPPDAGGGSWSSSGSAASTSAFTIGSTEEMPDLGDTLSLSAPPFVARAGEGPVDEALLTANVLTTSAAGLSMAQLVLIALLGLILLASMGFAISRTSGVPPAAA